MADSPEDLKEALDRIRQEPEWVMLWEHLMAARQAGLHRFLGCNNWEEFLEIRGEINAINVVLEWGDILLARLEEAKREVTNGRRERGREAGYSGR